MTPEAQLALIAAIPTILAALGTLIVIALGALGALIVAIRQAKKNAEITEKKLTEIHTTTNAHLTDVTTKWETATGTITNLESTIKGMEGTIKALTDAMATRTNNAKRETGDLIAAEVKNGNTVTHLLEEVAKLNELMATFADKGMPVTAPVGEPLPVVAVKASEVKK